MNHRLAAQYMEVNEPTRSFPHRCNYFRNATDTSFHVAWAVPREKTGNPGMERILPIPPSLPPSASPSTLPSTPIDASASSGKNRREDATSRPLCQQQPELEDSSGPSANFGISMMSRRHHPEETRSARKDRKDGGKEAREKR